MISNTKVLRSTFVILLLLFIIKMMSLLQHSSLFPFLLFIGIILLLSFLAHLFFLSSDTLSQTKKIKTEENNIKEIQLNVNTNGSDTPQTQYDSFMIFNQICHKFFTNNPLFSFKSLENGNNVVFDLNDNLPSYLASIKIQNSIPELKRIVQNHITHLLEENEENFSKLNKLLSTYNIQLTKLFSNDYYKKSFLFEECLTNKGYYSVFYGDNKKLSVLINQLCDHNTNSVDSNSVLNIIDLLKYRIVLNERVMSDMFICGINDLHRNLLVLYSFKRLREIVNTNFGLEFYNNKGSKLYGREWSNAFPTDTQLVAGVMINIIRPKLKEKLMLLSFPETPNYIGKKLYFYQKNPKEKEPYFCVIYKDTFIPGALEDNFFYALQLYFEIGTKHQVFLSSSINSATNMLRELLLYSNEKNY